MIGRRRHVGFRFDRRGQLAARAVGEAASSIGRGSISMPMVCMSSIGAPPHSGAASAPSGCGSGMELPKKFAKLESDIASAKDDFVLFALFQREDVPDRWDPFVSAPWATQDQKTAMDYLVTKIKSDLGPDDLTLLSRIIFVDPTEAAVENLNRAINVEHGSVEVRDTSFFGLPIKHAYIITSRRPSTLVTK